jgi:hypothetical protein
VNDKNENYDLLADVLAEAEPSGFRQALLGETLRQVRRRRRLRRSRPFVTVVALGVIVALIVSHFRRPRAPVLGYELVATQSFSPERIVTTQSFDRERLIASVASVPTLHTPLGGSGIQLLDDRQLLAVAGEANGAVLIRVGPHEQRLIFVGRGAQNGTALP